jgi:hypothetical protein
MYSWRQRADTTVYDEPFYAHYLSLDDRDHPGAAEVLASQSTDADEVIRDVILGDVATPVFYIKQMAHHLKGVDRSHLGLTENIILVRHPRDMLASLSVQLPRCELSDTGLVESVELLDAILAEGGDPIVIESQTLLKDPAGVLTSVCARLGLTFDEAMLAWPMGPKPQDGAWAPYWYDKVHTSTGFASPRSSTHPVPDRLGPILNEAMPLFERLNQYTVGAETTAG